MTLLGDDPAMSDNMQRELIQPGTNTSKFFALLIGIDCYLPNTLQGKRI